MEQEFKQCLNCGKDIPKYKIDALGRRQTRTSSFCDNNKKCNNEYVYKNNPDYQKKYYAKNTDKFKEYQRKYRKKLASDRKK